MSPRYRTGSRSPVLVSVAVAAAASVSVPDDRIRIRGSGRIPPSERLSAPPADVPSLRPSCVRCTGPIRAYHSLHSSWRKSFREPSVNNAKGGTFSGYPPPGSPAFRQPLRPLPNTTLTRRRWVTTPSRRMRVRRPALILALLNAMERVPGSDIVRGEQCRSQAPIPAYPHPLSCRRLRSSKRT